ncbi:MAG: shikimate dehydrogenase family protein [Bacteroidia bacterium]
MQLGLIGYPLKNGFSKAYFENKFKALNMENASYENFPIEDLKDFPLFLKMHPHLDGLSCTIPHKQNIISFLNETDETASKIGAVNCIKISKQTSEKPYLKGYNTDAYGFEVSLKNFLNEAPIKKALVFGIGGAAKAIIYTLQKMGIACTLVGREPSKALDKISYSDLQEAHFESHSLLVHCSPLGMHPQIENLLPIPYEWVNENHFCYDLIYNPDETRFLEACRKRGAKTKNGLEMLHAQAEMAFDIWSGKI